MGTCGADKDEDEREKITAAEAVKRRGPYFRSFFPCHTEPILQINSVTPKATIEMGAKALILRNHQNSSFKDQINGVEVAICESKLQPK